MAGAVAAVAVAKARQDILRHFIDRDATAPARAVGYDPDDDGWRRARVRRRLFRRMRDFGVVREGKAGLFWLDEERAAAFRWEERKRVLGLVALAGGVVAAIAALG